MWPYRAALIPVTLHADGFKTLWPANPFSINKTTGLAGGEGDKENLLSVFFLGGQLVGCVSERVLEVTPALTQLSISRKRGEGEAGGSWAKKN